VFLLSGALVAGAATPCGTLSVLAGSNFEIDTNANLKVDGGGDCIDWLADGSALRTGVLSKNDTPTGTSDDSFGQGTKEDDASPTIVDGSIPNNKSDLTHFGLYPEVTATGKFLELFWTRVQSPQGTTNMDFELNQKFCDPSATPTNCANNGVGVTPETPVRTVGDKLITYDLANGGTVPTISIRTWDGSAWGPATDMTTTGDALGSINTSPIAAADSGGLGALDALTFGEAVISFDAIFPNPEQCGALGSAYMKSRSSDSFQAEIKDFIAPERVSLSNCTSLTTNAQSPVTLGQPIFDVAHLTGSTVGAGGTITFKAYGPNDSACSNSPVFTSAPISVNGDGNYNSGNFTPSAVGTYYWTAVYSGDAHNKGSTSACGDPNESSVLNKAQLHVATTIHDAAHSPVADGSHLPLGSVVHDTARVTGQVLGIDPTGAVTFTFFSGPDCTSGSAIGTFASLDGGDPRSDATAALAAGSYGFKASVAGDANYLGDTSACEPFVVDKAQLSVSTVVHNGAHDDITGTEVPLGTSAHDNATVSGGVSGFPVPAVSFTFDGSAIANGSTEAPFDATSVATGPLSAGGHVFNATVASNANYVGATSADEPFTVDKAQLHVSTTVHDAGHNDITGQHVPLGSTAHDNATVTGGVAGFALPAVSFSFDAAPIANSATTEAGFTATSVATAALAAGGHVFNATVASNANYIGATSADEPFTVDKAQLHVSTTVHDAGHNDITGQHVPLGSTAHDNAAVTGGVAGFPLPAISFTFDGSSIANGSTEAPFDATSVATGPLGAGAHVFNASLAGNANYIGATSADEPFTVDKAQLHAATTIHDASHNAVANDSLLPLGSVVHDTAQITGQVSGFASTGAVTFTFYSGADCTSGAPIGTFATLDGGDPRSDATAALATGSYGFKATVAGDDNYLADTSACEPFFVGKAPSTTVTEIHDAAHQVVTAVALGSTVHDQATVSSPSDSFPITGTVAFRFYSTSDCSDDGVDSGTAPVNANGVAHPSDAQGPLAAGSYGFKATYSGDANYDGSTGACEPLHVNTAASSTATQLHSDATEAVIPIGGSVAPGTNVHDQAMVTDSIAGLDPTGDVTFTFFTNNTCEGQGVGKGTVALNGSGVAHPSQASGALAAGKYAFQAHYNGDDNFDPSASPCEPFQVVDANVQISPGSAINPVGTNHVLTITVSAVGGTIDAGPHTATASIVSGPGSFVGSSSCTYTGGAATASCKVTISSAAVGTTMVSATSAVPVNGVTITRTTGTAVNTGAGGSGNASKLWADASARTDILNASGGVVTSVVSGTVVHDKVFVDRLAGTPAGVPSPSGNVVFHRYSTVDCSGASAADQTVALTPGAPSTAVSADFAPTASMSYRAEYLGDANYPARTGACEPLTVTPVPAPAIAIVKNPKGQTVAVGGTARFTITVTNAGNTVLTNVTVTDPLSPDCNRTPAQIPGLASMAPGATVTYSCSRPNVRGNFDNVATATGTPPAGPNVTATDTAPVKAKALKPVKKKIKKKKKKPKVVSHKKPKATG
jgi:uncharacterized repeat protein (TIGR01451 family)